ncbi:efflux transporter outer membrane subunit [Asticcacaulis sp. AC466]|uniref:efflux transporter outer membrane subunit n=1 Tax=Asticcacaulis sp. AC466 TaxID=1282362 RepID=UPI0004CE0D12|nr:efflux transporter outer membrane subunit [Asticcacaulis sp. AC466]
MHSPASHKAPLPLRKAVSLSALVAAAAVLTACASVPASHTITPHSDLAATQSLPSESGQWPAREWWKGFNDAQLSALIDEAFAGSPDLLAAQARLDKALATQAQVKSALDPDLTLNGSVAATEQSLNMGFPQQFKSVLPQGVLPLGRITLDANYNIDLWGKSRAALKGAIGQAKASEVEREVVRQNLAVAVANAYVELNRLYETRDELAELKRGAAAKLDLYQARADHNLEPKDTVLSARDDQQQLDRRLATIDGAIQLQDNLIAALVGAGPDRGLSISRPQLAPSEITTLPGNVPADLIGRRPDVVAARLRVEAAGQGIKYAKADYYPNLNLSLSWGREALGLQYFGQSASNFGSFGPAISLPLFHQKRLNASYRSYEADYNSAVATYDQTLTTALHEVADAAGRTKATTAELAAAQGRHDTALQGYELSKARFGKGLATKIDVISAHARVVSAENEITDLKAQAYRDRITFIAALGGGYQSQN